MHPSNCVILRGQGTAAFSLELSAGFHRAKVCSIPAVCRAALQRAPRASSASLPADKGVLCCNTIDICNVALFYYGKVSCSLAHFLLLHFNAYREDFSGLIVLRSQTPTQSTASSCGAPSTRSCSVELLENVQTRPQRYPEG